MEKPKKVIEGYLKSGILEITMKRLMINEIETLECMKRIWGLLSDDDVGMLAHRLLVPKLTELMHRVKDFSGNSDIVWASVTIVSRLLKHANKEEKRILACRPGLRTLAEMVVKNHDNHKLVFSKDTKSLQLIVIFNTICALNQKLAGSNDENLTYPMLAGATRVLLPLIARFLRSFLTQLSSMDEYHRNMFGTLVGENALLHCLLTSDQSGDILLLVKTNIVSYLLDIYKKKSEYTVCDRATFFSIELCFQYIGNLRITKTKEKLPYIKTLVQALQIKELATRKMFPPFYDNYQKRPCPYELYGENIVHFLGAPGSSQLMDDVPHSEEYQRALLENQAAEAIVRFILLCVGNAKMMNNLYTSYCLLFTKCKLADLVDCLVPGYHVLLKHVEHIDSVLGRYHDNVAYSTIVQSLGKCLENCSSKQRLTDLVMQGNLFEVLATYTTTKCTDCRLILDDFLPVLSITMIFSHVGIEPKLLADKTPMLIHDALCTKLKLMKRNPFIPPDMITFITQAIIQTTNTYLPYVINKIIDAKPIDELCANFINLGPEKPILDQIFHVLPTVWAFIKRDPPGRVVEALAASARRCGYTFLPYVSSEKSKKSKKNKKMNPVENKAKLYTYLNEKLIKFLDNPIIREDVSEVKDLKELSNNLVAMVKSHTTDEELYALEDLASPVMWLASKTDIEVVINNVKMFIRILHSE